MCYPLKGRHLAALKPKWVQQIPAVPALAARQGPGRFFMKLSLMGAAHREAAGLATDDAGGFGEGASHHGARQDQLEGPRLQLPSNWFGENWRKGIGLKLGPGGNPKLPPARTLQQVQTPQTNSNN